MTEGIIKERKRTGKMDVYRGKPNIWNVLDNSYDTDQKVKSQLDVNDQKLIKVLTDEGLSIKDRNKDAESDVEEDVEEVPTKTKYYD